MNPSQTSDINISKTNEDRKTIFQCLSHNFSCFKYWFKNEECCALVSTYSRSPTSSQSGGAWIIRVNKPEDPRQVINLSEPPSLLTMLHRHVRRCLCKMFSLLKVRMWVLVCSWFTSLKSSLFSPLSQYSLLSQLVYSAWFVHDVADVIENYSRNMNQMQDTTVEIFGEKSSDSTWQTAIWTSSADIKKVLLQ